jgi:biopolymer transport protein ExbD
MRISKNTPKKARIEIIPMIDTIFFLLVFFMLATLSMISNNGLPVNLPEAKGIQTESRQLIRTLTLTQDDKLFFDKEPVKSSAEIKALLVDGSDAALQALVIINADRGARHGRVIELMDAVKQAGITQVAIAVNPSP